MFAVNFILLWRGQEETKRKNENSLVHELVRKILFVDNWSVINNSSNRNVFHNL